MISRTSKGARIIWSTGYALILLAGILAFFAPSQLIERALVESLVYLWAGFLVSGAGACLGGKLRNNWAGELIGLPLLSAASYVFGLVLFMAGTTIAAIAIGGIFLGHGTAFVGRWVELRKLAKENLGVNDAV